MILKIAQIGHPVLRQRAREVSRDELLDPLMQQFIDDLVETMRDASGAGLAAIQVHEAVRIVAIEVKDNPRYPYKPNIPSPSWSTRCSGPSRRSASTTTRGA
jgi:peptide deformylase